MPADQHDMYARIRGPASWIIRAATAGHSGLRPSVINELAGPVSEITNRLLDDHVESLDLAAHLAEPMPIAVLGQLLGVSLSEAEGRQLKRWCDDFLLPFGRDIGTLSPDELARVRSAARICGYRAEPSSRERG